MRRPGATPVLSATLLNTSVTLGRHTGAASAALAAFQPASADDATAGASAAHAAAPRPVLTRAWTMATPSHAFPDARSFSAAAGPSDGAPAWAAGGGSGPSFAPWSSDSFRDGPYAAASSFSSSSAPSHTSGPCLRLECSVSDVSVQDLLGSVEHRNVLAPNHTPSQVSLRDG